MAQAYVYLNELAKDDSYGDSILFSGFLHQRKQKNLVVVNANKQVIFSLELESAKKFYDALTAEEQEKLKTLPVNFYFVGTSQIRLNKKIFGLAD